MSRIVTVQNENFVKRLQTSSTLREEFTGYCTGDLENKSIIDIAIKYCNDVNIKNIEGRYLLIFSLHYVNGTEGLVYLNNLSIDDVCDIYCISVGNEGALQLQKVSKDVIVSDCSQLTTIQPMLNPFTYDVNSRTLLIVGETPVRITMNPADVVEFVYGISALKGVLHSKVTINGNEDLISRLKHENYRKLTGPIDCDVYGCFNSDHPNLLMLEIVYPYTGSRHINVAIDLDKF